MLNGLMFPDRKSDGMMVNILTVLSLFFFFCLILFLFFHLFFPVPQSFFFLFLSKAFLKWLTEGQREMGEGRGEKRKSEKEREKWSDSQWRWVQTVTLRAEAREHDGEGERDSIALLKTNIFPCVARKGHFLPRNQHQWKTQTSCCQINWWR